MKLRGRLKSDAGETLLELVMAIGILAIVVVAIASTITISAVVSGVHRDQASAQAYARDYAEQIEAYVASGSGGTQRYVACAGAGAYSPGTVGYTVPGGFTASVSAASVWNGSAWVACGTDSGVQKVTVSVVSPQIGARQANETIDVVLRKPCRDTDNVC